MFKYFIQITDIEYHVNPTLNVATINIRGVQLSISLRRFLWNVNTFAASYLNTQGLNNSCLKSPASTLVALTFQSRALRSFSLNQLRNLSL